MSLVNCWEGGRLAESFCMRTQLGRNVAFNFDGMCKHVIFHISSHMKRAGRDGSFLELTRCNRSAAAPCSGVPAALMTTPLWSCGVVFDTASAIIPSPNPTLVVAYFAIFCSSYEAPRNHYPKLLWSHCPRIRRSEQSGK